MLDVNVPYFATVLLGNIFLSISVCVGDYNWGTKHHHCMSMEINKDLICERI